MYCPSFRKMYFSSVLSCWEPVHSSGKSAAKLIQQESLDKLNGQVHTMKRIVALRREAERRIALREATLESDRKRAREDAFLANRPGLRSQP